MVTLLGFLFVVVNVFLIEIFVPDLVGPVSLFWSGWLCTDTEHFH